MRGLDIDSGDEDSRFNAGREEAEGTAVAGERGDERVGYVYTWREVITP